VEEVGTESGMTSIGVIGLALSSVMLSALSQIALKAGMTSSAVRSAIATSSSTQVIVAVSHSWLILSGLLSFGLSALVWLAVLSRVPLSTAYPVVALGIVITSAAGLVFFNEPFSSLKVVGIFLIVSGVVVVALSSRVALI
jgi:multidrug transporter EmrE-like cation transporter